MGSPRSYALLGLFLFLQFFTNAQTHPLLQKLDSLITLDAFTEAEQLINSQVVSNNQQNSLNLGRLVYPLARTEFLTDHQTGFAKAKDLLAMLESAKSQDTIRYEAYLGLGLAYLDQGRPALAEGYISKANAMANDLNDPERKLRTAYNLGETGLKLGNFDQLQYWNNRSLRILEKYPNRKFGLAPRVLNYKASLMHFMAKPDSVDYYFDRAIKSVDLTDPDPEYRYYLPGVIYGNWTMAKQTAGDYDGAMEFTLRCISYYNAFLQRAHNHPLTEKVHGNLSIAYRNLGSIYNDLGDKEKAIQVATLGYHHAQKYFLPNTVEHFSAVLMLGEAYLYAESPEKARKYLTEAEHILKSIPGDNWSYVANMYAVLGDLEKREGHLKEAIFHYQNTLLAYANSSPDEFSQNVIYARFNLAQMLAEDHQFAPALQLVDQTYAQTEATYGKGSYMAKMVQLTKIRISFIKGDYAQTMVLCKGLLREYADMGSLEQQAYFSGDLAEILCYLAKSKFELLPHTEAHLEEIAQTIDRATAFVEKRKSLVTSQTAVANLIESNLDIFNFAKKVYTERYLITGENKYLNRVITLHESSIYNRIRARLNLNGDRLSPKEIREREHGLRKKIDGFFVQGEEGTQFDVVQWDSLNGAWQNFLKMLQKEYPRYYRMRYASIVEPLQNLGQNVPATTTIVRYFMEGNDGYAYVYHKGEAHLVKLGNIKNLDTSAILDFSVPEDRLFQNLYDLYVRLWKPLETYITTPNVVILPDGDLFNLSFELLTPRKIGALRELATESLLAQYNMSYNYSLYMVDRQQKVLDFKDNYVAFAPEFDSGMKSDYQMAILDTLDLDRSYLTLLPQPFSSQLAQKFGKVFNGEAFLNERASKQLFSKRAGEHKIIHIGTHAESNNLSPELSRLVFAKNVSDTSKINDNFLYTYEIYNQNLNANLAILTACETGKPSYQPGEGMISLAHAFNYAGSESILTSLWQIDEKSSSEILSSFYAYLRKGNPKDMALRLAKLDYLAKAEGRTLHPQYWAGLILMGNTAPLELSAPTPWLGWIIAGLGMMVLVILFLIYKKKTPVERG